MELSPQPTHFIIKYIRTRKYKKDANTVKLQTKTFMHMLLQKYSSEVNCTQATAFTYPSE